MKNIMNQDVSTYTVPAFQNLRKEFGLKPLEKRTPKESHVKAFSNRHTCPTCKQAMNWIAGTNVCACTNPGCLGIKRTRKNKEDENVEETYYTTAYHTLREADEKLAEKIFGGIK